METGLTRSKNNINVALKNLVDFGLTTILFWMFGFALMFGATSGGYVGTSQFFPNFTAENIDTAVFLIFQVMFCGTAVTILSGAIAERLRFSAYIVLTLMVSGLIYPVFGHWAWHGIDQGVFTGWLGQMGFRDFAGSTVVHSVGGWASLAILLIIGPRKGRFQADGTPNQITGANLPLAALGVLLLWMGWFGFNGGSTLVWDETVISIIVNTLFAGAAGMVSASIMNYVLQRQVEVHAVMNGILAGLVAITAGAHAVTTLDAVIIGFVGGVIMLLIDGLLLRLKIDDAVGAIPVHLGAGIFGTLAVGIWGNPTIIASDPDLFNRLNFIGVQSLGIVVAGAWTFGITYIAFRFFDTIMPLRVSEEAEEVGLNISEHGARNELYSLIETIDVQTQTGDLSIRAEIEPFTQVGVIAERYNRMLDMLENAVSRTDSIVQTAMDSIITFSDDVFRIDTINPATVAVFGYESDALVGEPITRLLLPWSTMHRQGVSPDTSSFQSTIADMLQSNEYRELVGQRADGTPFSLEMQVAVVETTSEHFYTATLRDITERKESELRIQRSEIYFRQLIEKASDLITIIDETGIITYQSPSSERLLGFSKDTMIDQSFFEWLHPNEHKTLRRQLGKFASDDQNTARFDFRLRNHDGVYRYFTGELTNLLNEDVISGIVINARDVTERRIVEERLADNQANLSSLIESTQDLIWSIDENYQIITHNSSTVRAMKVLVGSDVYAGADGIAMLPAE
ncbi:MAG: ammonium transporter, partial [Chloroflexota bacterium]